MSSECAEEETERFSSIKQDMESLEEAMKQKNYKMGMDDLLRINQSMEIVFDQYAKNHDMHQPTMVINMDHCLIIRNTLLYNVLWVIGPFIYPIEADVDWDTFTSVLPLSEEVLRDGYVSLRHVTNDDAIRQIVTISLKAGTVEDFEIAGIVYSTSYFLHFLLKQEEVQGPFLPLVDAFYSHMKNYSFVLLVTSVLSIQRYVSSSILYHLKTRGRDASLNRSLNRFMGRITMLDGGVRGVISTLLSYVDGGDITVLPSHRHHLGDHPCRSRDRDLSERTRRRCLLRQRREASILASQRRHMQPVRPLRLRPRD